MPDEQPKVRAVRARDAASLLVLRHTRNEPEMLMGMRGSRHRFMPNRLVFPGGAVDKADMKAPFKTPMSEHTARLLRKDASPALAHGIASAAARELQEETGLTLGEPAALDGLEFLARAVTPPENPIRFNARFLVVAADRVSGTIGGDGELDNLRYYGLAEAMAMDLALPTRRVLERLIEWMKLSEDERRAQTLTAVLRRDQGWVME